MHKLSKSRVSDDILAELKHAGDRSSMIEQKDKKNYAQRFSDALAKKVANALRPRFPGILPGEDGKGRESSARTGKGFKRLDVNFSTLELGLALGVSLKSVNFSEGKSKNYAKNVTARDNELRAEAEDYHTRQPFAVMVALYFLPLDACDNATTRKPSSFGHTVKILRHRARRRRVDDPPSIFEKVFVGLYSPEGSSKGDVRFFDVELDPPWSGSPTKTLSFSEMVSAIEREFARRNDTVFVWSDRGVTETPQNAIVEGEDEDAE